MIEDIAQYIDDNSLGTWADTGGTIFTSFQPASPDNCITILDTAGTEPNEISGLHFPTFQVIVRNTDYQTGRALFESIKTLLHSTKNMTIGNTYFYYILLITEGGHIGDDGNGRDEIGRDEWSCNFRCQTR